MLQRFAKHADKQGRIMRRIFSGITVTFLLNRLHYAKEMKRFISECVIKKSEMVQIKGTSPAAIHYAGRSSPSMINKSINRWAETTRTFMEWKVWAAFGFKSQRCHSFCSFNGFRHLSCKSGNAVTVCVWNGRNTVLASTGGRWRQQCDSEQTPLKSACFFCDQTACSTGW